MSENKNGSRWWEFNLVRYFLGTLVGSFIVYLVFNHFVDNLDQKNYSYIWEKLSVLQTLKEKYNQLFYLGAGFVFCYVASSPILVFHATRLRKQKCFKLEDFLMHLVLGANIFLICIVLLSNFITFLQPLECFILLAFILFTVFQILLLNNAVQKENDVIKRYVRLTKNRETTNFKSKANEPNGRSTYVESYKHLREHGNAFFIVILEIILGLFLYHIETTELTIMCIVIWITPGALIWFFGNYLEKSLYE